MSGGFVARSEHEVFSGHRLTVTRAEFSDPDGQPFEREVVRSLAAVAVVAIDDDGAAVLVRQFRPAVGTLVLEVVAGTCDVEGEPLEATARRELAEEAGYAASELTLLTRCLITPGFCDEYSSVFLARGLTEVTTDRQGAEERFMRVVEVPIDQFDELVDDGTIIDATTILGVALARRRMDGGEPMVSPTP